MKRILMLISAMLMLAFTFSCSDDKPAEEVDRIPVNMMDDFVAAGYTFLDSDGNPVPSKVTVRAGDRIMLHAYCDGVPINYFDYTINILKFYDANVFDVLAEFDGDSPCITFFAKNPGTTSVRFELIRLASHDSRLPRKTVARMTFEVTVTDGQE